MSGPADEARARVEAFTRRHFSLRGSLRLHRAAIGWDLLRAPVNTLLAPLNLVLRLVAALLHLLGLRMVAARLAARPLILHTAVAARIEDLVRRELLGEGLAGAGGPSPRHLRAYGDTRGAVAEFTSSMVPLGLGATLFKTLTPGVLSLAPAFALSFAQGAAIAAFPLGGGFGALWYGAFPAEPSVALSVLVVVSMILVMSLAATFAGVIADPVQLWSGTHRRRMLRLIAALEAEAQASEAAHFAAHEHYLARVWDATDAGVSLIRLLRP